MPASPIRPAPTCSWRSVREPSSDFESFRWTITSRRMPISRSNPPRSSSVTPGFERSYPAPQAWATSRQKPTRSSPMPRAAIASARAASCSTVVPSPNPPPEEFSRTIIGVSAVCLHLGERPRHAVGEAIDARLDAGPTMRPDVHVDVACPEARPVRSSWARISTERSQNVGSGPARFTRYAAWIATGSIPYAASRLRNSGSSFGGAVRRRHAVGLSEKIWIASAPISCARSTAFTIPVPSGRWAPRRRPSGSIRGIVRCPHDGSRSR